MLLGDSPTVVWSHGLRGAVRIRWCSEDFWSADPTSDRYALLRSTFRRPPVPILSPSHRFLARCLKGFRRRHRCCLCSCPKLGRHLHYVTIQLGCLGGAAQVLRDEFLPSVGIMHGGIPAPVFISPTCPQRNKFH